MVESYCEGREQISSKEILHNCLQIEASRRSVVDNRIVSDILRKIGYKQDKNQTRHHTWGRVRLWRKFLTPIPETISETPEIEPENQLEQGVQDQCLTKSQIIEEKNIASETINTPMMINLDANSRNENKESIRQPNSESLTQSQVNPVSLNSDNSNQTNEIQISEEQTSEEQISYTFAEICQIIEQEMARLNLSKSWGKKYLKAKYGTHARVKLSDEQLFEFLSYLKARKS